MAQFWPGRPRSQLARKSGPHFSFPNSAFHGAWPRPRRPANRDLISHFCVQIPRIGPRTIEIGPVTIEIGRDTIGIWSVSGRWERFGPKSGPHFSFLCPHSHGFRSRPPPRPQQPANRILISHFRFSCFQRGRSRRGRRAISQKRKLNLNPF